MKPQTIILLLFLACLVWETCVCWTLNDLYSDYVKKVQHSWKKDNVARRPKEEVQTYDFKPVDKRIHQRNTNKKNEVPPTQSITLLNTNDHAPSTKKDKGGLRNKYPEGMMQYSALPTYMYNSYFTNAMTTSVDEIKKQTKLIDPVSSSTAESFHDLHKLPNNYIPSYIRGPVDENEEHAQEYGSNPNPSVSGPCIPSRSVICPTSPVVLFNRKDTTKASNEKLPNPVHTAATHKQRIVHYKHNPQDTPTIVTAHKKKAEWPGSLKRFIGMNERGSFAFNSATCKSLPYEWGVRVTCEPKVSFESLLKTIFPKGLDLNTPSKELIVPGKFDCFSFDVNRDLGNIIFSLKSRELLDIIPNKIRVSNANATVGFSYQQLPKTVKDFDIGLGGQLKLESGARKMKVESKKPKDSTLFTIDMETKDLEIPEFTKLFTDAELSQQRSELPPDLGTLVASSLRNPRVTGLYDVNGAFEFIATSKSPASIFPSQPTVYIVVQKPRLGKVVTGAVCKFEDASYRSFISSIMNQDFSNIPLFNDVQTDMAIGISRDGLYTVRDDNFKREMGSLLNNGNTIKKGLTVKSALPIRKMVEDTNQNGMLSNLTMQAYPEKVLVNTEVTGNRMHIEFPDDLRIGLSGIPQLFGQRGENMNFPQNVLNMDDTDFQIKGYDIDDIDKKALSVYFEAPSTMNIGTLMSLNNAKATLRRDELSKWNFNATGDYKLGNTTVGITLKSKDNGFLISSDKSNIQSATLTTLLDKRSNVLKNEMNKFHMDDFVIDDFHVSGALTNKNTIRFIGKPSIFDVEDGEIEFIANEEPNQEDTLVMGVLFKHVDLDHVFGRMLDKKMSRRSWTTGVNTGLVIASNRNAESLAFQSPDLSAYKIEPGSHLSVLLKRPEFSQCKGDSLCRMLSNEMPRNSKGFQLTGGMENGKLHLSTPIEDPLVVNKALQLSDASLRMNVDRHIDISVPTAMNLPGVVVPFNGFLNVDNAGLLQLNMKSDNSWDKPFGLQNARFQNLSLSTSYEPGTPLPSFDVNARMYIGRDPSDETRAIEAPAVLKINAIDPSKNTFTAKLHDISFEKIAQAFGTKKPLLRFQHEAYFPEDSTLLFEPSKDVENYNENNVNGPPKGQLKATGRMRILGQNAQYNIKFLNKDNEILTEAWLPDIGVNQGLMTIHAGLKSETRSEIEPEVHNGPALLVRMDPSVNSAVLVGKVSTLRFSRLSALKLDNDGLSGTIFANLPGGISANVSLKSNYEDNIQDSTFEASSCLPVTANVKSDIFKFLHETAAQTKKTLIEAEDRVSATEKIYETTKSMIEKHKKDSQGYINELRGKAEDMLKLRKGIKRHCVRDCGESCMGLPSWKKDGIAVVGHDVVGSPTWESCSRKIPDLNCITRCLGRKVIQNVKANNKQAELQNLMEALSNTKRSLQDARSLVERGRSLVDSTLNGLEKVNSEIKVGVDISKFLNDKNAENSVKINNVCFKDSLENVERSLVNFFVDADVGMAKRTINVEAALDGNLESNLAEGIANQMYPGYFEFSKKLEQVKLLLSNLDGQKGDISRDIDDVSNGKGESQVQRSQIAWSAEEDEFRKLAFGELPRFTLSDDETIHAFEEKSIWEIAPGNNPLFQPTKKVNGQKATKKSLVAADKSEKEENKTLCGQLRNSINHFQNIIYPLSEFTESFLQEKIMFYRQKNRRLADLRMIDDQIKSDCFVENCTMEDMDNALSYLGRAREGTLKWSKVIEGQIEDQNKVALAYFANRTHDTIEADKGISLRHFITRTKDTAQNAIKKSSVSQKENADDKIEGISENLYNLLVGVKNSEELSKMAPKIFNMKQQIQELKKFKIPCSESKLKHKLHLKVESVPSGGAAKRNATGASFEHTSSTTPKGTKKASKEVKPSAQPLVTKAIVKIRSGTNQHYSKDFTTRIVKSTVQNTSHSKKPTVQNNNEQRAKVIKSLKKQEKLSPKRQHSQASKSQQSERSETGLRREHVYQPVQTPYNNLMEDNLQDEEMRRREEIYRQEVAPNELQYYTNTNYQTPNEYSPYPYWKK